VCEPLLRAFPFPSTLGEVTLHQFFQAGLFIYSSHRKWAFPPLLWSFPPTITFTSFPTPGYWAGATTPAFSSQLVYLQFHEGLPLLPLRHSWHPTLFSMCLFYCCYYSVCFFLFFSLGGGWSVQGAMLIWPRVVCGSTTCSLAHLVVCFSQVG
jgi:hypothetical protein